MSLSKKVSQIFEVYLFNFFFISLVKLANERHFHSRILVLQT